MKKQEEVASVLGPPFWLILDVVNEGNWNPAGHVIIVMVTVPFWVPDFQNTILISFELAKYYCFCLLIHIPHLFFHILSPLVNIKRRLLKHSMFPGRSLVCPNFLCFISYWSMPHHPSVDLFTDKEYTRNCQKFYETNAGLPIFCARNRKSKNPCTS
jgi:hypothetical protein